MVIAIKLPRTICKTIKHVDKNKNIYLTLAYAVCLSVAPGLFSNSSSTLADIDTGGKIIHAKIASIGKWVIVIKGSIDTIQSVLNGDFQSAKKQFFAYLLCFAVILGLPWGLDQVEEVFKNA